MNAFDPVPIASEVVELAPLRVVAVAAAVVAELAAAVAELAAAVALVAALVAEVAAPEIAVVVGPSSRAVPFESYATTLDALLLAVSS